MTLDITNITSPIEFLVYVNSEVSGLLGVGILFSLAIILFLNFKLRGNNTPTSTLITCFGLEIVCILLRVLGLASDQMVLIISTLLVLSFLWLSSQNR